MEDVSGVLIMEDASGMIGEDVSGCIMEDVSCKMYQEC